MGNINKRFSLFLFWVLVNLLFLVVFLFLGVINIIFTLFYYKYYKSIKITASNYNKSLALVSFLSLLIILVCVILIGLKISTYNIIFIGLLLICLIFNVIFLIKNNRIDSLLINGEKILIDLDGIQVSYVNYYGAIGTFFLKKVIVTNKRIILSSNYFGVETFFMPSSFFYKKPEGMRVNKLVGLNYVIKEYWLEKGDICFEIGLKKAKLIKYKLNTEKAKEIYRIIKSNSFK